jgi:hypothetical protein
MTQQERNLLLASAKGAIYNNIGGSAFKAKYGNWQSMAIGADADDFLENLLAWTVAFSKKYTYLHRGFVTAVNQGMIKSNDPIYGLTGKQISQIGQTTYYIAGSNFIADFVDGVNIVRPQSFEDGGIQKRVPFSGVDGNTSNPISTNTGTGKLALTFVVGGLAGFVVAKLFK